MCKVFIKILFIFASTLEIVHADCSPITGWMYEIKNGIMMAESQGKNALLISGYAYHTSIPAHWPTGLADQKPSDPLGLNEIPYGLGYGRSWHNQDTHEEYTLFGIAFADSYWKPGVHVGYMYQKSHPIMDDDNLEWGLGYAPQIFVKPSWTSSFPVPIPGIGFVSSIRYKDFEINSTWANVIFVNAKISFN